MTGEQVYPITKALPAEQVTDYPGVLIAGMLASVDPLRLSALADLNDRRVAELDGLADLARRHSDVLHDSWYGTAAAAAQRDLRETYANARALAGKARQMSEALRYAAYALADARTRAMHPPGAPDYDPTSLASRTYWQPILATLNAQYHEAAEMMPSEMAYRFGNQGSVGEGQWDSLPVPGNSRSGVASGQPATASISVGSDSHLDFVVQDPHGSVPDGRADWVGVPGSKAIAQGGAALSHSRAETGASQYPTGPDRPVGDLGIPGQNLSSRPASRQDRSSPSGSSLAGVDSAYVIDGLKSSGGDVGPGNVVRAGGDPQYRTSADGSGSGAVKASKQSAGGVAENGNRGVLGPGSPPPDGDNSTLRERKYFLKEERDLWGAYPGIPPELLYGILADLPGEEEDDLAEGDEDWDGEDWSST